MRITFDHPEGDRRAVRKLHEHHEQQIADGVREQLGSQVTISLSDPDLFLYAETRDAARAACEVVRGVLAEHSLPAAVSIDFWHPVRTTWERVDEAALDTATRGDTSERDGIPDDQELARLEQEHRNAMRRVQVQRGEANWWVRIEIPDHQACIEYARRLSKAGHPAVLHRSYLLLGASSEYEASILARMVGQDGPPGCIVKTMLAPYTATTVTEVERIDAQEAKEAEDISDLGSEVADLEETGTTVVGVLDAGSDALHVGSGAAKLVKTGETGEGETAAGVSVSDVGRDIATLVETDNTRESQVAADVLNLGSDALDVRKDIAKLVKTDSTREGKAATDVLDLGSDLLHVGSDVLGLGSDAAKLERD